MQEKINVLVVEDEMIVSLELQDRLKSLGYNVCGDASSGEDALLRIEKFRPDVVLMDIMLKGPIDGVMAAEKIKLKYTIPVIFLTAYSDNATLERAKITEPYGYLLKPFDERMLSTTIEMALLRHKLEIKLKSSESWLTTILKSIGDAVIATDANGVIKFMNPIAEKLTGWSEEEALNHTLNQVYRLVIPGQNGDKVKDSNLQKDGNIQYRILLSKNNRQIFIEETYSFIKTDQKKVIGSVLAFRDVSERIQAQERKNILVNELENINKELQDFAYIVSHDLKAPLRAVGSLAEWILTDYVGNFDDKGKEMMNLLMGRVNRMHELIEGVLQYSRLGRFREDKMPVDLNSILKKVIENSDVTKNIVIKVENELPEIEIEPVRIEQVFQNLIGNAIKYNDKQEGLVKIGCLELENSWKFWVADNGPGIDKKYFDKIFQIFQTLNARDDVESTGIGLTLVKKIVEMYQGKVWLESEIGKGCTFYFTLPKLIGE